MRVTVGDSGLCCYIWVTYLERQLTPLCVKISPVSELQFAHEGYKYNPFFFFKTRKGLTEYWNAVFERGEMKVRE